MREKHEVRIEKLVYGGDGLGRHHGKVVFVPYSVPGDTLLVRTGETKKSFARAGIFQVIEPASDRRTPLCPYFGRCGGCHWQHIEYRGQVEAKRLILEEILCHRFAEARDLLIGMRASPAEYGYRSRARLQIGTSQRGYDIGFFRARSHAVQDIPFCPLFQPALNGALSAVRERLRRSTGSVAPASLEIACSQETEKWASSSEAPAGVQLRAVLHPADEDLLFRSIRGNRYALSPAAFFQANDFMLTDLLDSVLEPAKQSGARFAVELYCGVGLFTLPLARVTERVIAVESLAAAADLCAANASWNGLSNIRVIQADVRAWIQSEGRQSRETADLVLLNPPRAGAGPEIMRNLASWRPSSIIYVSCDPQTLTRDVSVLRECGYRLNAVEGLDLFPQTYHFETVVALSRS